jgi:hypothetical protein
MVKFNHEGIAKVLIDNKPIGLGKNDKLFLSIPYSLLIRDSDPSRFIYYETKFDGGETYSLRNP